MVQQQGDGVSHGDILFQIGELKGQLTSLLIATGEKREDLNSCFVRLGALEKSTIPRAEIESAYKINENRIGALEKQIARWAGITFAVSFGLPLVLAFLTTALSPRLQLGEPDHSPTSFIRPTTSQP